MPALHGRRRRSPSGSSLSPGGGGCSTSISAPRPSTSGLISPILHRGHKGDPVGRQARREHGDADDDGRAAAHERGGAAHHLTIGQHVGAAELDLLGRVVALGEVGERLDHVRERDRLRLRVQPARHDHHRQAPDEVLEDVVGGAARADDHRRAHVDERRPARAQQARDLVARVQVLGVARSRARRGRRRARRRPAPRPRRS